MYLHSLYNYLNYCYVPAFTKVLEATAILALMELVLTSYLSLCLQLIAQGQDTESAQKTLNEATGEEQHLSEVTGKRSALWFSTTWMSLPQWLHLPNEVRILQSTTGIAEFGNHYHNSTCLMIKHIPMLPVLLDQTFKSKVKSFFESSLDDTNDYCPQTYKLIPFYGRTVISSLPPPWKNPILYL